MYLKDISTEDLVNELKTLTGDLDDNQLKRKSRIVQEIDERIIYIQDMLMEFDDIPRNAYMTVDNILDNLRNKIGAY